MVMGEVYVIDESNDIVVVLGCTNTLVTVGYFAKVNGSLPGAGIMTGSREGFEATARKMTRHVVAIEA